MGVVITAENISKSYGLKCLFSNITFGISEGEKIGLIGVNGTGKSTLIKMLAGIEVPDSGQILKANAARIGYLPQNPSFFGDASILDYVIQGSSPVMCLLHDYEAARQLAERHPMDETIQARLLKLSQQMDEINAWNLESEAKTILTKLGFSDFDRSIQQLSGGQRKRVAMAAALINPVDLLILDEPTNHIDNQTIDWVEQFLHQRTGALLMITHDRYFLDRVTDRIVELDQGKLYSYKGNYSTFLEKKAERMEQEASLAAKRNNLFRRELAWIRRGAKARSTKQQARIDRFEQLKDEMVRGEGNQAIEISAGSSRLGKKIIHIDKVKKSFAGLTLIDNFSYTLTRKDRVGIIGGNGVGKSTLLNMIAGYIEPDQGKIELGPTVKIGFFTQDSGELNEELRVIEYIQEQAEHIATADGITISASQMLECFLFPTDVQWSPIAKLSGGERRRLYLLRILMGAPNVLLMDEPTNDLDITTLTILEEYLEEYPGVVIAVSHDRYFLDRMAEKIIAFQENGKLHCTVGNYTYYCEEQQRLSLPRNTNEPKKPTVSSTEAKTRKTKLSYMEQREFDGIEEVIAQTEGELVEIKTKIQNCGSDYQRLQELMEVQENLEKQLEERLERWAYLSELIADYEK